MQELVSLQALQTRLTFQGQLRLRTQLVAARPVVRVKELAEVGKHAEGVDSLQFDFHLLAAEGLNRSGPVNRQNISILARVDSFEALRSAFKRFNKLFQDPQLALRQRRADTGGLAAEF